MEKTENQATSNGPNYRGIKAMPFVIGMFLHTHADTKGYVSFIK